MSCSPVGSNCLDDKEMDDFFSIKREINAVPTLHVTLAGSFSNLACSVCYKWVESRVITVLLTKNNRTVLV